MFKNKRPIRLKVVSDGTPRNTHVIDEETGRELSNVVALSWEGDANDGRSMLTLKMIGPAVEIDGVWQLEETTTKYTTWSQ